MTAWRPLLEQARRSATRAAVVHGVLLGAVLVLATIGLVAGSGKTLGVTITLDVLLVSLFGWRLIVALRRRARPERHPMVAGLARFGDPAQVAREIDAEAPGARRFGNVLVTRRFLVVTGVAREIVALDELGWVYPKVTSRSVNFVPLGSTESLELHTRRAPHRVLPLSVLAQEGLYAYLQDVAPQARFGFSPQLQAWWRAEISRKDTAAGARG
jgi:hypothetical protein